LTLWIFGVVDLEKGKKSKAKEIHTDITLWILFWNQSETLIGINPDSTKRTIRNRWFTGSIARFLLFEFKG
jgi:hypothetical protein